MSEAASASQPLAIVAAVARNGGIGFRGQLPWQLPGDLRHFREISWGKPLIMGRRTHLSIGRPLPGRDNIVLSSDPALEKPGRHGVQVARGLAQALRLAAGCGGAEVLVIGGARLYEEALPLAQRLYLTEVDARPPADVFFPHFEPTDWEERESRVAEPLPGDEYSYRFRVLERRQ